MWKQLEADRMAHSEPSERGGGQGHCRRRPRRWNGPNPFHNDSRGPLFQQYNGWAGPGALRAGPRVPPAGRRDGNTGALDELTLKHMAQDCSSVRNKLLKLKCLLQMEEGGPEIVDDNEEEFSTNLQLEELMKEVQRLREELRSKERTISQLTQQQLQLQQQVPVQTVHSHQRAPSFRGDVKTHHDKATQTPWRGQGHNQTGVPSAPFSPWQGQYQGPPRPTTPQRRQTSITSLTAARPEVRTLP